MMRPPRLPVHAPRFGRGFTLIEALVVLVVTGVLMSLVVPSFSSAYLSNKLSSYSNSWVASAQLARSEAVKRNSAITLCRSADGATCATSGTWQQGWIVMCNMDPATPGICNSAGAATLVLQAQQALSSDYHFTSGSYSIPFQPTGIGATSTTLTLCRATPSAGNQERVITLSATGKPSVKTTRTGVCT